MSRHRSSSKRAPPEIGLHMECVEEELEPSQIAYYNKAEKEYNEVQAKLDNYVKKMKAEVVEKGENCLVLQINAKPPATVAVPPPAQVTTQSPSGTNARQTSQNYQSAVGKGIVTRSSSNGSGSTYLVMDPRLGFVVGQMPSQKVSAEQPANPTTLKTVSTGRNRAASTPQAVMVTTRAKSNLKKQTSTTTETDMPTPPMTRTRDKTKTQAQTQQATTPHATVQINQPQPVYSTPTTSTPPSYRVKVGAKHMPPPAKPSENTALGGLTAGSKTPWKPDEPSCSKGTAADSREVTFNKVTGKTFPSLVVVARPHLKVKFIRQSNITQERSALDAKVKGVLMYTPAKFTEWLIQQGLIRSEQTCQTHVNHDLTPVKLKLGMYSDVSKFPYSGGYAWISDCCPSQFVSVFSGSIFEGAPHPPTTILKLIYHWACQTNVQNIVQWVKVDNLYVKNFFTNMRAVCTQAVHEKYKKMGGPRMRIEVGVISLGTTSQDGNKRQVKIEVLGVIDQESKLIRLRAVEPLPEERSFKRRFMKILEPLEEWVHKESTILTDCTMDKAVLNSMGFHSVFQATPCDPPTKYSNQNVMEYLRRILPRMFQNTLSLLSRQIIQQFLDELVWREMWGPIASQAFVNIIAHMAEQTKLDVTENFLARLNKVASNPFKQWDYSVWKPVVNNMSNTKLQAVPSSTSQETTAVSESFDSGGKGIRTRKRAAEQSSLDTPATSPAKKLTKSPTKEKFKKEEKLKSVEKAVKKEKESGDKLTEEVAKFLNEGNQISLERYYYGTRAGDEHRTHEFIGPFNVKCSVCNKRFSENIILMKHMILHCQAEPVLTIDIKKVQQCQYCFLGFNAKLELKAHLEEVHAIVNGQVNSNLLCQICEEKFTNRNELIFHMHKTHVELEMPYECGVCRFRSSVYKVFIDHFMKAHKDEEHVFCPYCLKVVTLWYKGVVISSNVIFYMAHLEKHQRLSLVKDCSRCQLSFIHKGILDQHVEADHGSWKNENGIQYIAELPGGLLMPEPGGVIKPSIGIKAFKSPKTKNLYSVTKFKTLAIYGLEEDMACVECEGSLTKSEHFTGCFNCLKCRYSTCCERAMIQHSVVFHETPNPQYTMGRPIVLSNEMYCICEYSSSSGNRIAKHLAICERKSAYSSKEAAAAAIQCKSPKDRIHDKIKPGEGQNVLNMLGLVRKSPEANPVESSSMKKGVEEKAFSDDLDVKQEKQDAEITGVGTEVERIMECQNDDSEALNESESLMPKNEEGERKFSNKVPAASCSERQVENSESHSTLEVPEDSTEPKHLPGTLTEITKEEKQVELEKIVRTSEVEKILDEGEREKLSLNVEDNNRPNEIFNAEVSLHGEESERDEKKINEESLMDFSETATFEEKSEAKRKDDKNSQNFLIEGAKYEEAIPDGNVRANECVDAESEVIFENEGAPDTVDSGNKNSDEEEEGKVLDSPS